MSERRAPAATPATRYMTPNATVRRRIRWGPPNPCTESPQSRVYFGRMLFAREPSRKGRESGGREGGDVAVGCPLQEEVGDNVPQDRRELEAVAAASPDGDHSRAAREGTEDEELIGRVGVHADDRPDNVRPDALQRRLGERPNGREVGRGHVAFE